MNRDFVFSKSFNSRFNRQDIMHFGEIFQSQGGSPFTIHYLLFTIHSSLLSLEGDYMQKDVSHFFPIYKAYVGWGFLFSGGSVFEAFEVNHFYERCV